MKKGLVFILIILMFAFTACGGSTPADDNGYQNDHEYAYNPCDYECEAHPETGECHCHGHCDTEGCVCHGAH